MGGGRNDRLEDTRADGADAVRPVEGEAGCVHPGGDPQPDGLGPPVGGDRGLALTPTAR